MGSKCYLKFLISLCRKAGRIKALLLRRINDYFGDAFGDAFGNASAAFWQAAAAAAIEEPQ